MGLEDRDYYRENYAKKHGMRYNARNATYSDDPEAEPSMRRQPPRKPPPVVVEAAMTPLEFQAQKRKEGWQEVRGALVLLILFLWALYFFSRQS